MHRRVGRPPSIFVTHDQVEAMTLADRIVVMNGGTVQQQGSPEDLYRRPANLFVAGFLGAPPMNLLRARLVRENDAIFAMGESFGIRLARSRYEALEAQRSDEVMLGLRPSAIHVGDAPAGAEPLQLDVMLSEYVGAQSVLLTRCGKSPVIVEINSESRMHAAGRQNFWFDPESIHLFDPANERAIR
jgi:multiple sugar transport system ATP-binding protein